jgi:DNA primase
MSKVLYDPSRYLNYVHNLLLTGEGGSYDEIKDYLSTRGVTDEIIKRYKLGYSVSSIPPADNHPDQARLKEQMFNFSAMKKTLILPMRNPAGILSGLVIRALPWSGFKFRYRIFMTSDGEEFGAIFGLQEAMAEIVRTGVVYVVEGPFDAMAMGRVLPNTVAAMTAELNDRQVWILSMLAENVVVVFDSDGPGKGGAIKASEKLRKRVKNVSIKSSPYNDMGSSLENLGFDKFKTMVEARIKVF